MTTQQGIQIFKWLAALIIAVLLFMLGRGCGKGKAIKPVADTLSIKKDTVWMKSTTDTFYTPQITKTRWRDKEVHDTLETFEYIIADTSLVMQEYFSVNYYEDTIPVKYGNVYINDTVTENKIVSRGVETNFNIPAIKETVTIQRQKKNIAYLSLGAMGSTESFLQQTSIGFGIKNKKDKYFGGEAAISREGYLLFGGKIMLPIKLNKN